MPLEIFAAPYNEEWKKNKKFALTTMRSYGFATAAGEAKILDQIDNMAVVISKNGSKPMNPDELCRKAAACVIFAIVMGKRFSYEDEELKRLLVVIEEFFTAAADPTMVAADLFPTWLFRRLFPGFVNKLDKTLQDYRTILLEFILPHLDEFDSNNPRDVVDGYLKERGVNNFDPTLMANNVLSFTVDAVSTLSAVINCILFYLAKHPDVQSRVQSELDAEIGSSRKVTSKDRASLPLVDALIHESSRLASAAPLITRHVKQTTKLMGYTIPKGTTVWMNIWNVHMSPDFYKDPENFHLEHFLQEDGSVVRSPEAFMPFGLGRCISSNFSNIINII